MLDQNKINRIAEVLPELPILETAKKYEYKSLEQIQDMYYTGMISQDEYEAYCYLWRNLSFHFSNNLIHYEISSIK